MNGRLAARPRRVGGVCLAVATCAVLMAAGVASAANITWTGSGDGTRSVARTASRGMM